MLSAKDIHKHEVYNICGKCYVDIHNPRVRMIGIHKLLSFYFYQEFLAEGEETSAERRARLAREAEERERRGQAGEEELMKQVHIHAFTKRF